MKDGVPTRWVAAESLPKALDEVAGPDRTRPFLLLDLFSLDDGLGDHEGGPAPTVVYVLLRPTPFATLHMKVRVEGEGLTLPSVSALFPNAHVLERAVTERAGICFSSAVVSRALGEGGEQARPSHMNGHQPVDDDELDLERTLARALAIEALQGIAPPPRADAIRVLRSELLRVASHLTWYAAFVDVVGASAAASFAPSDVRRAVSMAYGLGGGDPDGVVVGGVREDLPSGWRAALEGFVEEMTPRVQGYAELASTSPRLLDASKGVSPLDARAVSSWALTGPLMRAAGLACDLRKARPYCGYERYDFQVPAGVHGDVYDRARVRLDELRQSLRILAQCAEGMPEGGIRADVPDALTPGEAFAAVEGSRGVCACTVASDGGALFVHERTPGLAHRQALKAMSRGYDAGARATIESSVDLGESRL